MAMAMKKYLIPLTAAIILLITATGIIRADANSPVQVKPDANKVAKTISAAAPVFQQNDQTAKMQQENERLKTENLILENAVKAYEKSITHLNWALGIVIIFVGYIAFKSTREYRESLRDIKEVYKDAKEMSKDAEKAAEKACEWERNAQKTFNEIDKKVNEKLAEIEKKANEIIEKKSNEAIAQIGEKAESERKKSQKDAEKARKISELWAAGVRAHSEGRFEDSCKSWQEMASIKPDMHEAWNYWGSTLLDQAEKKKGPEKKKLLQEAKEKCLKAEQIKKGEGSYNLACISAIDGNEDECKKWLKTGEDEGTLDARKHAMADEYLKTYREKDWFKAIKWKGEK
jgi:hypothetical protein